MLFIDGSLFFLPAQLTNSSLSADSKLNAIQGDNQTPFPLDNKNRPLMANALPPPLPSSHLDGPKEIRLRTAWMD